MISTLSRYIGEYKTSSLLTVLFTVAEVIFEILIPFMMSRIIDIGLNNADMNKVIMYGCIMLVLAAASLFCGIMSGRYAAYSSSGFAANLRRGMYENIQSFSFSNIDKYSSAGLVTRLTTDISNLQNAYQMIVRMLMRAPATLISAMTMAVLISPKLSMVFVSAIVFLGITLALIMKVAIKAFNQVFEKYDELNAGVQENIRGIRVVKAFVQEKHEIDKFDKAVLNLYTLFVKAEAAICINNPVMMFSAFFCILALSWLGAHMIVSGELTTGELTSLFSYVMNILVSLMMLSFAFVMISMSEASAKRIAEVLEEKADIANPESPVYEVADGGIEFENVCFSYSRTGKKYVLSDINLRINSGETIGIIGGTGSSKTSLVNLISRLYDVSCGSVKVGGRDVREYDIEALRAAVSVVLQKNVLFSGTIMENLRWGDENADEEECRRACRLACADEFIERMPEGYNTYIEQGGSNVSGGQRQRLCIARALLKKPKILILDDSTSAVDTSTDARIRSALKNELPDTTKLIIAQRISTVKEADRIIVLNEGRVDAFGTHEELMESNEIYRAVALGQMEGSGDFDRTGA